MIVLLLPLWLAAEPPADAYPQATAELERALVEVGGEDISFSQSIAELEQAITKLAEFPAQLPNDAATHERLSNARLTLVLLYLSEGDQRDEAKASAVMDEAIRSARGKALPVGRFGTDVLRLHEERREALGEQGAALLEIDCGKVACEVVIDERRSPNPSDPLLLGRYRVWIGSREGLTEWEYHEIVLAEPGVTQTLVYAAGTGYINPNPPPGPEPAPASISIQQLPDRNKPRTLPRWASGVGIGVGVVLAIAGGVIASFHGKCKDGSSPSPPAPGDSPPCGDELYNAYPAGFSLLAGGAGVLLSFGGLLAVDEVRVGKAKGRQATLTWTLRF